MTRRLLAVAFVLGATACVDDTRHAPPARISSDIHLPADTTVIQGVVPPRATLDTILRAHGVAVDIAAAAAKAAATVFDPRRLRAQQPFALEVTHDGRIESFDYDIDLASILRIVPADRDAATYAAEIVPVPATVERVTVAAAISEHAPSLFEAVASGGERDELAMALAQIFAAEIDFNSELQPGDRFAAVFERVRREGRGDTYGAIAAAEFHNDGRVLRAIRFAPAGTPDYYDENARSLRRFFLRSPLKFDPRITSRFSTRRRHPVLHVVRAHRGVDYAAPTGAPVVAIASGRVLSAGYDRTNGRMVRLRHASGYESYYLHLSAFARGIRPGARVMQGASIGLVGSSGLATGPHLHFGLKKNGAWVDPLREQQRLPPGDPMPDSARPAFEAERDRALEHLATALARLPDGSSRAAD